MIRSSMRPILLLILPFAVSCVAGGSIPGGVPDPGEGVWDLMDFGTVTLTDGQYEGVDREFAYLLEEPRMTGDWDGDGKTDVAAVLVWQGGGSGAFVFLAVATGAGSRDTFFLGDRTLVNSLTDDGDRLTADLTVHGPDDPMCCPTMPAVRRFAWEDGIVERR